MKITKIYRKLVIAIVGAAVLIAPAAVYASSTPTLDQSISDGTLSTNIYQSDDQTPVTSPTVSFSAVDESFGCQTTTATLGDSSDKVNVTNLDSSGGNSGWTLTIAATGGSSATWSDGSSHNYKYNDPTGSPAGCTNGQLTIDPSVATLTDDCDSSCTDTDITQGSSTALNSGGTDTVTLMTDSDYNAWEGYLTGISLSQKIPAKQYPASYSLGMTITVTAD